LAAPYGYNDANHGAPAVQRNDAIHSSTIKTHQESVSMRWMIYIMGSGWFVLLGIMCISLALLSFSTPGRLPGQRRLGVLLSLLAAIFLTICGTPFPDWFYWLAGCVSLLWFVAEQSTPLGRIRTRQRLRTITVLVWLSGLAWELPYHFVPVVRVSAQSPLSIVGDSVTAGIGEHEAITWPNVLARDHGVDVHDFSRMGAGVASALTQAERLGDSGGLVLLEIGGNDLFRPISVADYELGLERLLTQVCTDNRTVLMFELPLPPFYNRFGQVQRKLAARHRVPLIPKRILMGVLTGKDTTLDSIHLSQAGHDQMAKVVWNLIRSADTK
jgi:acyl-CoA thioesterase-1